ncbi:MAG: metallophosphoesterase [Nitrosopumilus sp.]|nr:metallophosphoesterase [Nitrosopumilus sp.]CAI9832149.1 conserved hypothetical protein [Nitrosopumilaceae archaeon]MDA7942766.1 metallophosphoesterase [Nitrosopumilus sp.]MDA7945350.1 metallophosphoesterase [Nitrosopumilus sp.]MDA7952720.1 metallophosphoesterase [Nitrosopumilus sp.]
MRVPTDGRVLIIPDIHDKIARAEQIIGAEDPAHVVFLGDYFDGFDTGTREARRTAAWLKKSVRMPDRTHLLGNHDAGYMTLNPELACSGRTAEKERIISKAGIEWDRMRLYCWAGEWLCSHAGLSARLCRAEGWDAQEALRRADREMHAIDDRMPPGPCLAAGRSRGGTGEVGGMTWCDYAEFEDIPGTRQIFGHTRGDVRHVKSGDTEHYCIDTELKSYAILEDGVMEIRNIAGTEAGGQ